MKIFFYCYPPGPAEKSGYEHQIISIAEGLEFHNVEFYANVNYWKRSLSENDYLIKKADNSVLEDFDVVVFSSSLFYYNRLDILPDNLFSKDRNYKLVFIDCADGRISPGFKEEIRNVDLVLKSHYCTKYSYPDNFTPWQFGLTNRIINSAKPLPFSERNNTTLVNYRVRHQLRDLVERSVMPHFYKEFKKDASIDSFEDTGANELDNLLWKQTGRRHNPKYYERLGRSKVCSAFGGCLQKKISNDQDLFSKLMRKIDYRLNLYPFDRTFQYDSWRFWESMVSACCTLHIDFEKYGAKFPLMPENGKHYLGVDLDNLSRVKDILQNKDNIKEIGEGGREWVLKNYSPDKIAERFLNLIE